MRHSSNKSAVSFTFSSRIYIIICFPLLVFFPHSMVWVTGENRNIVTGMKKYLQHLHLQYPDIDDHLLWHHPEMWVNAGASPEEDCLQVCKKCSGFMCCLLFMWQPCTSSSHWFDSPGLLFLHEILNFTTRGNYAYLFF